MENVQLTVADLASIKSLLEAACQRGAFRANEMSTVGAAFDKLVRFIEVYNASNTPKGDSNA